VKDIAGQRFGRLVALAPDGITRDGNMIWKCECDCGATAHVRSGSLCRGSTVSCGCRRREATAEASLKHGLRRKGAHHPLVPVFDAMHARCSNPKRDDFYLYGGRGIRVCGRWMSLEAFIADMSPRPNGTTLDRIDSSRDYEPSNCRWATPTQQSNNRPSWNLPVTLDGRTMNVSEWARELGVNPFLVYGRLRRGWDARRALTAPAAYRGQHTRALSSAIAALQEATR
jgi:hypothetical protein